SPWGEGAAPATPPPLPAAPDVEEMTEHSYVKLHYPGPGLRAVPERFTWYHFPGAASYTLVLIDAEAEVLHEWPGLTDNMFEPPADWRSVFPSAGIYFWQVIAANGGGEPVAQSSLRDFVYAP
ncbi:MAG: hypothetical protein ABIH26_10390, partial [Candidatus Eisenbacteria bacterium]